VDLETPYPFLCGFGDSRFSFSQPCNGEMCKDDRASFSQTVKRNGAPNDLCETSIPAVVSSMGDRALRLETVRRK